MLRYAKWEHIVIYGMKLGSTVWVGPRILSDWDTLIRIRSDQDDNTMNQIVLDDGLYYVRYVDMII